ncbi:MAG: 5'-nucleotidase C-terminal domain-containing protein [Bacteroidales bacterium]|nr:5'-nucleotidase C-terminal domain-containing protein [Bacteroidales bacterium]
MRKYIIGALALLALAACTNKPKDGDYTLELLTTNDLHGSYFDSTYVNNDTRRSLLSVNYYVDSVRTAVGKENVILLDAGDFLQGDNAAYYYNYVDTTSEHIFSRMASYMGYDVVVSGNHDIETGHAVYDRIGKELNARGIPFLGGNAIRNDDGKRYFPEQAIIKKNGLKVLVLGYNNASISTWLDETIWSGMHFESLLPLVQKDVDEIVEKQKPQVVIVAVHSGTGAGNGEMLESQGLDLFNSLRGVDFVVCAHDHRAVTRQNDSICLINSGSHARNIGHGTISVKVKDGKVIEKKMEAGMIPVSADKADTQMRAAFQADYLKVKEFTLQEVGNLEMELKTSDAFMGMSDYVNFVHTVQLTSTPARISFAAPLKYNGYVKSGTVLYNDLFTIYPYENQLFVVKMTGKEIKDYLECSYDTWIQTIKSANDHVLNIRQVGDPRNSQEGWSFVHRSYNFDSAAGVNYTVDVTKPFGERITLSTMASGEPFDITETYEVAMTSYRANGGGELLEKAGIPDSSDRIVLKAKEIRDLVYDFFLTHGTVTHELVGDPSIIGKWEFIPSDMAKKAINADMLLLFR